MSEWTDADVPSMAGRTVVITGANGGLGYEATRVFARKGATVIMACRSVERGARAKSAIRREEGRSRVPEEALVVRECDLASLASIRSFAEGITADFDAIDVLCNNAGVMAIPRSETEDGFETQFGVNHLGHFALTGRLFPLLRAAEAARVITHSSAAHEQGEMDFTDLNWERSYGKWRAYGRSKLANLLFAYELQRRLEKHDMETIKSVACIRL
ncbi:NAD(P)-dependent dehydrogenase, short-chain alcohol dehydrogenase family [Halorubrum vacuolatum]|uniref:NAD(P)-dependent dehydrogenase, short-chain alcohol dehydrogenase family n=1 Tax=Halorubrum vacuolatum TaxID=63740 RepID=A0A238XMT3_HALVU|nr:NAD(P)-dependent dehydrogenase, short-chain alcohol dehydrogenase family [Halorubrum vacuolatum]